MNIIPDNGMITMAEMALTPVKLLGFIPVLGQAADGGGSFLISSDSVYGSLLVLLVILVLIIGLLAFISANLANLIRIREGKEAYNLPGTLSLTLRILKNRYVAIFGNFVLLIVAVTFLAKTARGIGLHQDYQPKQPIAFDHSTHAGKLEIDCQYCHSGASKGKNAWIPSVNVCWNCHKTIKEGPKTGTKEIAKITKAYENGERIEWVRIHNLPDHVYFNHQQHVVAGNVECQTCHGPIEEMEEVYQHAKLSMGWCITCHHETELNHNLYEQIGKDTKGMTVEDNGGTNCARCHY